MPADSTTRETTISEMLDERILAGDFPSAVYLISEKGASVFADALGHAVVDPYRITASFNTIYDLASLTKPLVTGMLCAQRIDAGELTLDSAVAHYLPEFDRTDRQMMTVRQLLIHSSGLPAWRPLYILAERERERALGVIANEALEYKPGSRVLYSDLGFIVLGFLLERLTGKELGELARAEIFNPLKLEHTFFNPEMALQTGIAACETGNAYERETALASGSQDYADWRKYVIWGEVHDGNAYFLGGVAGHAGLFSTATETNRLATQFLPHQSELLSARTCTELFTVNMTPGLNEARSISWQLAETPESAAGSSLPTKSFGHSGFTGTSCWIDPDHERIFILLTNRTHARSLPFVNINSVRREFHSLAAAALDLRVGVKPKV
jgi:CubicO group peptidase (beta-lactamase class C family)